MNPLYPATVILILAIALFYQLIIKPNQDAKNKIKQEAKEKAEIDKLLSATPTFFTQDSYKGFELTELNATSLWKQIFLMRILLI